MSQVLSLKANKKRQKNSLLSFLTKWKLFRLILASKKNYFIVIGEYKEQRIKPKRKKRCVDCFIYYYYLWRLFVVNYEINESVFQTVLFHYGYTEKCSHQAQYPRY